MDQKLEILFESIVSQQQNEMRNVQVTREDLMPVFYNLANEVYEKHPEIDNFDEFAYLVSVKTRDYLLDMNKDSKLLTEKLRQMQEMINVSKPQMPSAIDFTEKTSDEKITAEDSSIEELFKAFYGGGMGGMGGLGGLGGLGGIDAAKQNNTAAKLVPTMVVICGSGEKKVNWKKCRRVHLVQADACGVNYLIHENNNDFWFRENDKPLIKVSVPLQGEAYNGNVLRIIKEIEKGVNEKSHYKSKYKYHFSLVNNKCQIQVKATNAQSTVTEEIDTASVPNQTLQIEIHWEKNPSLAHILGFDSTKNSIFDSSETLLSNKLVVPIITNPRVLLNIPELNDFQMLITVPTASNHDSVTTTLEYSHDFEALDNDKENTLFPDIEKINLNFKLLDGTDYVFPKHQIYFYCMVYAEQVNEKFV